MNYGSFGFLSNDKKLFYELDVLNAFNLTLGSSVYGIYYPRGDTKHDKNYKYSTTQHDLMLTTIPPDKWPITARLHLHLSQKSKSLDRICEYFERNQISIIQSESSRSGHRYCTWSLHIAFEKLIVNDMNFVSGEMSKRDGTVWKKHYYDQTKIELDNLIKSLEEDADCEQILYYPDSYPAVDGMVSYPLAYYYNYFSTNYSISEGNILFRPFTLNVEKENKHFCLYSIEFQKLIDYLQHKNEQILPATTFSELSTRALNLRTAILNENTRKRFFRIGFEYSVDTNQAKSIGLLHKLTAKMPERYSLWHSYNNITTYDKDFEKGTIVLTIEDTINVNQETDNRTSQIYCEDAKCEFESILERSSSDATKFKQIGLLPLPNSDEIKKMLEYKLIERDYSEFKYDVFISYSHKDYANVQNVLKRFQNANLEVFEYSGSIGFGKDIDNEVLQAILDSREMCHIYSANSKDSDWVKKEQGAAWILSKKNTMITLPGCTVDDTDKTTRFARFDNEDEMVRVVNEIIESRAEHSAYRFMRYFSGK